MLAVTRGDGIVLLAEAGYGELRSRKALGSGILPAEMQRARAMIPLALLGAGFMLTGVGAAPDPARAGGPAAAVAGPYRNGLVAFARCCGPETGIYVIRPDGSGEKRIFAPAGDDAPLVPAWSPDGKRIAFVPGPPRRGIWTMLASGAAKRRITAGKGDSVFPSFSPGGGWIVFSDVGSRRTGRHDLYVVRSDGSGLRRITRTSADETTPAWAPNRGEIVYGRGCDLWRTNPAGSGARLLARNASSPSWSPGGSRVAFVRGGDPWVAARDGSGAKRVAKMARPQASVAWSPDGRWLVTAPANRGDLTLVRTDGSQSRTLTDKSGYGHSWPSWQRLPR